MLTIEKVKEMRGVLFFNNLTGARYMEILDSLEAALLVVEAANAYTKVYLSPVESDYLESSVSQKLIQSLKPFSPQPTKP